MRIGYWVPVVARMASFRLRVQVPAPHLGIPYDLGKTGRPTFFFKHQDGDLEIARSLKDGIVYDVVNDHFEGSHRDHYLVMCHMADVVTVGSETMAEVVRKHTGRPSIVIDDPYENEQWLPQCEGLNVLWFGHSSNIRSLFDVLDRIDDMKAEFTVCSNYPHEKTTFWTKETERRCLQQSAVVLVTGNNPGASSNRIVKALRAGRFVVTPGGVPAWEQFKDFIWIGDARKGIEWAFNNREEACRKVAAGQKYTQERFTPSLIGRQWATAFASISGAETKRQMAGSA